MKKYIIYLPLVAIGALVLAFIATKPSQPHLKVLTDPYTKQEVKGGWSGWLKQYEGIFGATTGQRPTDFSTTLNENLAASASTTEEITIASMTTTDGHTLVSADVGDFIAFHINPGASNDELVACTGGISGLTFVDCTRGYNFYNGSTNSSNAKAHSIGEPVVISNDDIWLNEQFTGVVDDETITGQWTFASSTAKTKVFVGDSNTYLWGYAGNFGFATSGSGELLFNTNGTTFLPVPALTLVSGELRIGTSSLSGLRLDSSGGLQIATSSGSGIYVDTDNVLKVATTSDFNFTGTFQLGGVTLSGLAATASSTALNNLTTGSTTPADYWHTHQFSKSYFTKATSTTIYGTTEAKLVDFKIGGGIMGDNGILRITAHGSSTPTGGNIKWMVFKFGDRTIATSTNLQLAGVGWTAHIDIYNQGSQSAQTAIFSFFKGGDHADSAMTTQVSSTPMTINTGADQVFQILGDSSNSDSGIGLDALDAQIIK